MIRIVNARILEAFGMKILAKDKYQDAAWENENRKYVDLDTLYAQSDVILLHCPLFADNRHMICEESIRKMKDGVILINNSRGGLVKDEDLAAALNSGKIAGAGRKNRLPFQIFRSMLKAEFLMSAR